MGRPVEAVRSGTFQAAIDSPSGAAFLAVGDFNGDGNADLAGAAGRSGSYLSVLLGTGSGTFQAPVSYPAGFEPPSLAVGDLNGDGKADLAVAHLTGVSVLLGRGDGTFPAAGNVPAGTNPDAVAVGDFNDDGAPDLAVANAGSNDVSVLLGARSGTFQGGHLLSDWAAVHIGGGGGFQWR